MEGLYDPRNEHDSCGLGFIANIKGRKSNDIIKKGIFIGPRERVKADIKHVGFDKGKYKWRVILREGKNREIRRIFLKYNQKVYNLHRYAFGGFTLKGIDRSKSKRISKKEIMTRLKIS